MNSQARRSLNGSNASAAIRQEPIGILPRRHKPDYWILILTAILLTVGLVVVYSISPGLAASYGISQNYFVTKQLIDVGLALFGFGLASHLPLKIWTRLTMPLVAVAIVCSVIVMFMPVDELYRANRWIRVGEFSFQVAELIKFALLIWAAGFLATRWREGRIDDFKATLRPLLIVILAVAVVVAKLQSDLGSAAVIVLMLGLMVYTAGIRLQRLLLIGGIMAALIILAVSTSSYRRERVINFMHPQTNCQDSGYQACQALISVGSGGVFGLGLGYSVQAYGYLPEASDDSIFAIIAEKFGFIGSVLVVLLYAVLISRLKRVIEHTGDQFLRLFTAGVLAWLSFQMIINIGSMVGLLPLKGITLPLISQGGTSLAMLTAAIGIVFQISRYTSYDANEPITKTKTTVRANDYPNRRRYGRAYNTAPVARPRNQR